MRALIAATLLLPASALAQATVNVPQVMGYQGRLVKPDGSQVTGPGENPSQVNIIFRVFGQEVGGTSMWEEKQTVLLTTKGFYAVFLGSEDSKKPQGEPKLVDVLDGSIRWLELQIEGDSMPLRPRQKIGSVAYSFVARQVIGGVTIQQPGATNPNGVTIQSPASLAKNYNLVLPTAPPASKLPILMDATGALSTGSIGSTQVGTLARPNLPPVGQQVTGSSGQWSTTSRSFVDVANLEVGLTTSGRPVVLALQPDGSGSGAYFYVNGTNSTLYVRLLRDDTEIARWSFNPGGATNVAIPASLFFVDAPSAGAHTWRFQAECEIGTQVFVTFATMVGYEL